MVQGTRGARALHHGSIFNHPGGAMRSSLFKRWVLSVTLLAFGFAAFPVRAYTGTVVPLPGWQQSGIAGAMSFARGGSAGSWVGGVFTGSTFMNATNGARAMTVGMRLTSAASATAAAAIRLNPTFATAAMATYMLGIAYNVATQQWEKTTTTLTETFQAPAYNAMTRTSRAALCTALIAAFGGTQTECSSTGGLWGYGRFCLNGGPAPGCYNLWLVSSVPSNSTVVANDAHWGEVAAQPLPDAVANALPSTLPLPVELPELEPIRTPVGLPYETPTGWKQDVEDTFPNPTLSEPWKVDIKPKTVTGDDPTTTGVDEFDDTPGAAEGEEDTITCGLPDTPRCKIDETGTETVTEPDTQSAIDEIMGPIIDIASGDLSIFPTFPTINWGFSLPTVCGPIAVPAFEPWLTSINICQFQSTFHDVMGLVWIIGGLFGAIGVFWRDQLAG